MNIFIYFVLVLKQSAALGFATQQTMLPEFGGNCEWSVSTLGSLCLPYYRVKVKKNIIREGYLHCYIMFKTNHQRGQSWRNGTKCDCKTDWLWVRSSLEEMKYLLKFIFPFLRSGVEVEHGVEFWNSTLNASRTQQKVGNGVF